MAAGVEPTIRATSNPTVAKRLGFTKWDRNRQQWVADPAEDTQTVDEVNDEDARGSDGVVTIAHDDDPDEIVDYTRWEYPALQAEAKRRGLDATGRKTEIAARLAEDDELADEDEE